MVKQEFYETASRQARPRAAQLRKLGFQVSVCSLGSQVTEYGRIQTTMLTIQLPNATGIYELPATTERQL